VPRITAPGPGPRPEPPPSRCSTHRSPRPTTTAGSPTTRTPPQERSRAAARRTRRRRWATAGVTPGPLSYAGTTFTWPGGSPDNVEANGQAIALTGTGTALAFLGASTNGTHGGTGTVYYSDATSQPFSLSFSDWWTPAPTDQVVATAAYINDPVAGRYPRFSYAGDAYLTTEGNVLRGLL
jgi:hypothetical protein